MQFNRILLLFSLCFLLLHSYAQQGTPQAQTQQPPKVFDASPTCIVTTTDAAAKQIPYKIKKNGFYGNKPGYANNVSCCCEKKLPGDEKPFHIKNKCLVKNYRTMTVINNEADSTLQPLAYKHTFEIASEMDRQTKENPDGIEYKLNFTTPPSSQAANWKLLVTQDDYSPPAQSATTISSIVNSFDFGKNTTAAQKIIDFINAYMLADKTVYIDADDRINIYTWRRTQVRILSFDKRGKIHFTTGPVEPTQVTRRGGLMMRVVTPPPHPEDINNWPKGNGADCFVYYKNTITQLTGKYSGPPQWQYADYFYSIDFTINKQTIDDSGVATETEVFRSSELSPIVPISPTSLTGNTKYTIKFTITNDTGVKYFLYLISLKLTPIQPK